MQRIRPPHAGTATNYLVKAGFPKYTDPSDGSGFHSRSTTPDETEAHPGGRLIIRWSSTAPVRELAHLETGRMLGALHVALTRYGYAVRRVTDTATGRPQPALLLVDEKHALARDLVAPEAPITLVDTSAYPVAYAVQFQQRLGEWVETTSGLTSAEVEAVVSCVRCGNHPVYQLLDGSVRIGKIAYVPAPAASVELLLDRRGEFTAPGGLGGWWVHEVSSNGGVTWELLDSKVLLLHERPTKKLFAAAAEFGQRMVYAPVTGQATGALLSAPGAPADRFTRLGNYLPDGEQAPTWQMTESGGAPQVVLALTVLLMIEDAYADSRSWAKLTQDGRLQLHRPGRPDTTFVPLPAAG